MMLVGRGGWQYVQVSLDLLEVVLVYAAFLCSFEVIGTLRTDCSSSLLVRWFGVVLGFFDRGCQVGEPLVASG